MLRHEMDSIETTLDSHLKATLEKAGNSLPIETRQEIEAEMRDHLESLIVAYEELGYDKEESVRMAARQFGSSREVGRAWRHEWRLTEEKQGSFKASLRIALTWLTATFVVPGAVAALSFWLSRLLTRSVFAEIGCLGLVAMYTAPILAGIAIGLRARVRPIQATLCAQALLIPSTVLVIALFSLLSRMSAQPFVDGWNVGGWMLLVQAPLSALTTGVGGMFRLWRNRNKQALT